MTYLYCLARSGRRPALRRAGGLPGAGRARVLDAGDGLWLVVADVDEQEYSEAAIARGLQRLEWVSPRAMAHEAVVEKFLSASAVLPMQLFTIFASDERALQWVRRDRARIDRVLERVGGHIEWGVRLTWNEQAARAGIERAHRGRAADGAPASGAAYLSRKRDLLAVGRRRLAEVRARATRLHRELSKRASAARRRSSTEQAAPGSRLLLDAAYLVPARRAAPFRAAVRQHARQLARDGIALSLTGPWPAYNFVSRR